MRTEQLRWSDISINNLWSEIETQARIAAILEDLTRDQWASKVILWPDTYTIERFPLIPPFVNGHNQYYKLTN